MLSVDLDLLALKVSPGYTNSFQSERDSHLGFQPVNVCRPLPGQPRPAAGDTRFAFGLVEHTIRTSRGEHIALDLFDKTKVAS
jgi:hypothetical protein